MRGVITLAYLERIEDVLRAAHGAPVRIGDFFDLIGSSSMGALISVALALGHSTRELKDYYLRLAPQAFRRSFWRIPGIQAKFDVRALRKEIDLIVGDRRLDSSDLITGLCVIMKRLDTGSPWIIANNPHAAYWNTIRSPDQTQGILGNRSYRLSNLVRASTAAPHYFDPEVLAITEDARTEPLADVNAQLAGYPGLSLIVSKLRAMLSLLGRAKTSAVTGGPRYGLFVDGSLSPFSDPSLMLFLMTQLAGYGINWPPGPDRLGVVSVGAGTYRTRVSLQELAWFGPLKISLRAMQSLIGDSEALTVTLMQWLGQSPRPWAINSEIGDLIGDAPAGGKMFSFVRYDVRLEQSWLQEYLDLRLSAADVERLRTVDDPALISELATIGRMAAERQVMVEDWIGSLSPLGSTVGNERGAVT